MTTKDNLEVQLRMYEGIWKAIASGTVKELPVRIHRNSADRLIQAVRKEKSRATVIRRKLGIPSYGRMTTRIRRDGEHVVIYFSLSYNGDMI